MHINKTVNAIWMLSVFSKFIYLFLWYTLSSGQIGVFSVGMFDLLSLILLGISLIPFSLGITLSRNIDEPADWVRKLIRSRGGDEQTSPLSVAVVSLGCIDSVAIIGLAYYIISANSLIFFLFIALSLIGWILSKPKMKYTD